MASIRQRAGRWQARVTRRGFGPETKTFKSKDESSSKTEVKQGRTQIEAYYRELFKTDGTLHAKNTIEYAREISPNLILFAGTFVLDSQAAEPLKIHFVQVRSKQGEEWRVVSMQVYVALDK